MAKTRGRENQRYLLIFKVFSTIVIAFVLERLGGCQPMECGELIGIISEPPRNFAWLLGAGASRSAGLPTATDILWDLKRRHYCREENQEVSQQDAENDAVREKIQSFMALAVLPHVIFLPLASLRFLPSQRSAV